MSVDQEKDMQKALKKRVRKQTERAATDMGIALMGWRVYIRFNEGSFGDWEQGGQVERTAAVTTVSWQYQNANIQWYLAPCHGQSDQELYEIAVHELVHVLTGALMSRLKSKDEELLNELNESVTEHLARALLSMRKVAP